MDMKEIFGTNQAIEGTRQIALKRTPEGKKPGINWALTLVIGFIVLMGATVASVIPALGLLIADAALSGEEVIITLSDLNTENTAFVLGSLWGEGFIIVAFLIYARINEMRKPATLGFKKKGFLLQYLIGAIAGIGSFSLALLINYVCKAVTITHSGSIDIVTMLAFSGGWILQGMGEEVTCRGFLLTSLSRRYSVTFGVIVSSLVFAALHLGNPGVTPLALINLFLFGIFAALMFIKTDNIWVCSAFHSFWNLVQGNLYGISVSGNEEMPTIFKTTLVEGKDFINGGAFGSEGGIAVSIVMILGCLILYFMSDRRARSTKS